MVTKDGEAGTMSVQSSTTHSLVSLAANVNGVNGAKATWTGKIGWQRKALKYFSLGIQVSTALIQKGNLGQCYEYLSNVQGAI